MCTSRPDMRLRDVKSFGHKKNIRQFAIIQQNSLSLQKYLMSVQVCKKCLIENGCTSAVPTGFCSDEPRTEIIYFLLPMLIAAIAKISIIIMIIIFIYKAPFLARQVKAFYNRYMQK